MRVNFFNAKLVVSFFMIINLFTQLNCVDEPSYYGQCHQDKFLNERYFKNKKNGVFVEIGAYDGILFSNTYFFEKYLGWKGICIEPIPSLFEKLVVNRPESICLQLCVSNFNGYANFLKIEGDTEMLSGMVDTYHPLHVERIDRAIEWSHGSKEVITVEVRALNDILRENGIYEIDFMSIDTEGGETEIITSLDLDTFTVHYIVVEDNYGDDRRIYDYLTEHGYELVEGAFIWDKLFKRKFITE